MYDETEYDNETERMHLGNVWVRTYGTVFSPKNTHEYTIDELEQILEIMKEAERRGNK